MPSTYQRVKAFTLIELSIVIVVIGLIVGGVLVGRDLVAASAIRAQISQIVSYNQAVNTFREKYGSIPGDLSSAHATSFALTPSGGNENGVLEDTIGNVPAAYVSNEPMYFFIKLSDAHLIIEKLSIISLHAVVGEQFPRAAIGKGGLLAYSTAALRLSYFLGLSTNSTAGATNIGSLTGGGVPVISPKESSMLDLKVDDGSPTTRHIRSTAVGPLRDGTTSDGQWHYCSTVPTAYESYTYPTCLLSIDIQ